ncbi:MAG: YqgE/AlgH family protein [Actinomycetota bacterium]|nr:YqgE/AlgH family protein [Actinomycetota bacterium]
MVAGSSLEGRLLVAGPLMSDPNFARTVVLTLSHSPEGSLGVVLDRPGEMPVAAALPKWEQATSEPRVVFRGGPVEPAATIGIARTGNQVATVDLAAGPVEGVADAVRLFSGYAGWGPGQLEMEVSVGAWIVVDAEPGDAFSRHPERLWRSVLRRQHGDAALLSAFPDDPSAN